jgi:hypothetical protein
VAFPIEFCARKRILENTGVLKTTISFNVKGAKAEEHRKSIKPRLWLGAGCILAVALTWSIYWSREVCPHFAGPRTYNFLDLQWSIVSFPGYILGDLFHIDVEVPYDSGITVAGVFLITLPNAIAFSGGAFLLLRILRRRALFDDRDVDHIESKSPCTYWNAIRVGATWGFSIGAGFTLIVEALLRLFWTTEGAVVGLLAICSVLLSTPTRLLVDLAGYHLNFIDATLATVCLVVITNGAALAALGALLCWGYKGAASTRSAE